MSGWGWSRERRHAHRQRTIWGSASRLRLRCWCNDECVRGLPAASDCPSQSRPGYHCIVMEWGRRAAPASRRLLLAAEQRFRRVVVVFHAFAPHREAANLLRQQQGGQARYWVVCVAPRHAAAQQATAGPAGGVRQRRRRDFPAMKLQLTLQATSARCSAAQRMCGKVQFALPGCTQPAGELTRRPRLAQMKKRSQSTMGICGSEAAWSSSLSEQAS